MKRKSNLKCSSVEGDVGNSFDSAVVQDIRYQEQPSYLFNDWGLNQIKGVNERTSVEDNHTMNSSLQALITKRTRRRALQQ